MSGYVGTVVWAFGGFDSLGSIAGEVGDCALISAIECLFVVVDKGWKTDVFPWAPYLHAAAVAQLLVPAYRHVSSQPDRLRGLNCFCKCCQVFLMLSSKVGSHKFDHGFDGCSSLCIVVVVVVVVVFFFFENFVSMELTGFGSWL